MHLKCSNPSHSLSSCVVRTLAHSSFAKTKRLIDEKQANLCSCNATVIAQQCGFHQPSPLSTFPHLLFHQLEFKLTYMISLPLDQHKIHSEGEKYILLTHTRNRTTNQSPVGWVNIQNVAGLLPFVSTRFEHPETEMFEDSCQ